MKPFAQDILKATLKTLLENYQSVENFLLASPELPLALPVDFPLWLQQEYQAISTALLANTTSVDSLRDKIVAALQENSQQVAQQLAELEAYDDLENKNFYL